MRYVIPIFLLLTAPAFAECMELTKAKENIAAKHGQWIDLTDGQWEFMRGVFWIHPKTPSRLPRGDRAAMASSPDHDDRMIFFIDGISKAAIRILRLAVSIGAIIWIVP